MGTKELASLAAESILRSDILLLENHGVLTVENPFWRHLTSLKYLKMLPG